MEKVVVSVDGSEASRAAVLWCAEQLPPGATVVVVCGISEFGELVISVPPLDGMAAETTIEECLKGSWCEPLRRAGLRCRPRLVHLRQVPALLEVVEREHPDALVVGREVHHGIDGLFGWGSLNQVVHRTTCPLVLVPAWTDAGDRARQPPLVMAAGLRTGAGRGVGGHVKSVASRRRRQPNVTQVLLDSTSQSSRPRPY